MSKEMRKHIDTFKKFNLNENSNLSFSYRGTELPAQEMIDWFTINFYVLNFEYFISRRIRSKKEGLDDTYWTGHNGETVTLRQILYFTKDIKVQEIDTEKLKKIVLSWDGNTEEIEKIEKSDIQYPVLILMNDDNTIRYILDGNHRIQKSIKYNLPTVKAKLIKFSNLPKWIQNILV